MAGLIDSGFSWGLKVILGLLIRVEDDEMLARDETLDFDNLFLLDALAASKLFNGLMPEVTLGIEALMEGVAWSSGLEVR